MRKFLISSIAALVALGLLMTGTPAQARSLSWTDPAGDATGIGPVASTPRPSDPSLDLLNVSYTTTGDSLLLTSRVQKFGSPDASVGSTFRWNFTYNDISYNVALQMPGNGGENVFASGPVFWKGSTNLGCGRCSVKNDAKANTVGVIIPFKSLTSGMKSADSGQKPVGPGSNFERLSAISQRIAGATLTADTATPKEGTTFTL